MIAAPERAQLKVQRREEQGRRAALAARLARLDPDQNPGAIEAVQQALNATAEKLETINAELAAPNLAEVEASALRVGVIRPSQRPDEPMTVLQAKQAARARMRMCLIAMQHLPEGCAAAAANLKRAISIEMRRLDRLKAVEARANRGRATCG